MRERTTYEGPDVLSIEQIKSVPHDWPNYSLTRSFDAMDGQAIATFANARALIQPIIDIDSCVVDRLPAIFDRPQQDEIPSSMLFARMFSVQRAAARLAFSGQHYEARAVLRSALECAVYGWALLSVEGVRDKWVNRDTDELSRNATRDAFQWAGLMRVLGTVAGPLSGRVHATYVSLISLGAHPNPGGVVGGTFLSEEDGSRMLMTNFGGGSAEEMRAGFCEYMEVVRQCFDLLKLTFPQRLAAADVIAPAHAAFDAFAVAQSAVQSI